MRIFIGYHYGPADAWVRNHVYRLVRAFGSEVDSGEQLYDGPNLSQAIIDKIHNCDAVIGVASRADRLAGGSYTTHRWVQDELAVARASDKRFVQLREVGIDPRLGLLESAQYIEYDAINLAEGLVRLAEALGTWHFKRNVPLNLLPPEFAAAITPHLLSQGFYCRFRIRDQDYKEKSQGNADIVRTPGGLRVVLFAVPHGHFIQLEAGHGNQRWISDVESVESPTITMKPVP